MTEAKPECNCFAPALFMRGDLEVLEIKLNMQLML